jgi:hypothetical protein
MASIQSAEVAAFRADVTALIARLKKSSAVHVNAESDVESTRALVQRWFRTVRPGLLESGISEEHLLATDIGMQTVLRLAGRRSRRASYVDTLTAAKEQLTELEVQQEVAISAMSRSAPAVSRSASEIAILDTLERLVPSAAFAYEQAIRDLEDSSRVSFRGPANELRSALWDVLDRLAPDKDVEAALGYKHEAGRTKPTQKQKARYILKSRSVPESSRKVPETTVDIVEERVGALTRATYDRSSLSAHLESARGEVQQLKMYVDSLLAELLEIHLR